MAYYRGDYYRRTARGDYYRGDPGFLSVLGAVGKAAFTAVTGVPFPGGAPKTTPAISPGTALQLRPSFPIGPGARVPMPMIPSRAEAEQMVRARQGLPLTPGQDIVLPGRRRKRMNVLNPKALRRSMSRVQGFAKFAKRTIDFTSKVRMRKRRKR